MTAVSELMSTNLVSIGPEETLVVAAQRMTERRVGSALVFAQDRLSGILTERDILRAVAEGAVGDADVRGWMTRHPETVEPDATAEDAAVLMLHGGFRHLPVSEGGRIVGIVSMRDLVAVAAADQAPRGV